MSTITATIQLRRDTSANWTSNNPILLAGEMALSTDVLYTGTDQPRYKIGNGVDTWLNLDYVPEGNEFPENLFLTVVNKTGDNLLATGYKVVRVSSAQGQRLAVDYALADSDANSADTIGIVYENIDNNQSGKIVVIGEITGINTTGSIQNESWSDGDLLFLSPFIEGGITNVRPTAPNHSVIIGYVVYAHANNGKIYCKIDNGYELGELHNVYAPSPNSNDGIFWSSGTNRYENKSIISALGYTPENTANKGVANGYAPLGADTRVAASYLPVYVDEVLEYANLAAFPATGQTGKIYLAFDTNKLYRWTGRIYVEISANSGVWGIITGTITSQLDLVNYVKSIGRTTFRHSTVTHVNVSYGAAAGNRWYSFASLGIGPQTYTSDPGTTATYIRAAALKTGTIVSAKISWYFATATPPANTNAATLSIRNATASSTHTITSSLVLAAGATSRGYVQTVSGLSIAVTENDELYSVIYYPQITTGNPPQILGLLVDYIIE